MNVPKYTLFANGARTHFEFTSVGPRGAIEKLVEFQELQRGILYNLAFGDKDGTTGELDDLAVSDNGDMEKVLTTVAAALLQFFEKHPAAAVYAAGSTPARTRLYRMGISRFYKEISERINLYGRIGEDFVPFKLRKEYDGFLAQRKFD